MQNYFQLVTEEFKSKSKQLNEFVKHGPSIGTANEVILRSFLKKYLPKWVSVGQGFIINSDGISSNQTDIIIYNSTFYAPLYEVEDLVVVPPESVILTIEVKTKINQTELHESINKMIDTKKINKNISTLLFIYNPPKKISTIKRYLQAYNFSDKDYEVLPDNIYGMGSYKIFKGRFIDKDTRKNQYKDGYLAYTPQSKVDFVVEDFYFDIYRKVELAINEQKEKGIDNVWRITRTEEGTAQIKTNGRLKFSSHTSKDTAIICSTSGVLTYKFPLSNYKKEKNN